MWFSLKRQSCLSIGDRRFSWQRLPSPLSFFPCPLLPRRRRLIASGCKLQSPRSETGCFVIALPLVPRASPRFSSIRSRFRARKKCKRIGRTRDPSEKAAFHRTTFEIIDVSDNIFSQVQRLMASQASCCDREKLISLSSS